MANCDQDPCVCPVCLDERNLLRLECNGHQHHYLCRDCLMKLRQFSPEEPDSFLFVPPRQIKWKLCPTCRQPIKRASRYNALLRHSGGESAEEHRGYLPETELQDDDFARQQYGVRAAEFNRSLIEFEVNIMRLERERAQIVSDIANVEGRIVDLLNNPPPLEPPREEPQQQLDQPENNRFTAITTLVSGCAIIAYYIVSFTNPIVPSSFVGGGDNEINETKKEIDRSNGIGVIYIGYSEGNFGLWWSTIQKDGTILNILINAEKQYNKLLGTYKFEPKTVFKISDIIKIVQFSNISEIIKYLNKFDKLNANKIDTNKGGSCKKRKMKKRSSRRKR
jgi:hypothetical protein